MTLQTIRGYYTRDPPQALIRIIPRIHKNHSLNPNNKNGDSFWQVSHLCYTPANDVVHQRCWLIAYTDVVTRNSWFMVCGLPNASTYALWLLPYASTQLPNGAAPSVINHWWLPCAGLGSTRAGSTFRTASDQRCATVHHRESVDKPRQWPLPDWISIIVRKKYIIYLDNFRARIVNL